MLDLTPQTLVLGFLWYIAFLFSTTCHEASHALAAKIGGDFTAAEGGQVTLNPLPHMRREFFGMVIVPVLSFLFANSMIGWASAPYDPQWEQRHPRRAAVMALAGPAANFTLMLLAAVLIRFGRHDGWFHPDPVTGGPSIFGLVLGIFFSLNLLLGTFNLLPVPPLDGSTAVMVFMSERHAGRYLDWLRGNSFALAGLLIALLIFRYAYEPIENAATQFFIYRPF